MTHLYSRPARAAEWTKGARRGGVRNAEKVYRKPGWSVAAVCLLFGMGAALAQTATTPGFDQANCNDPLLGSSAACQGQTNASPLTPQTQSLGGQANGYPDTTMQRTPDGQLYVDSAGLETRRQTTQSNDRTAQFFPPDPLTDFQKLARSSTGEMLPIFGRDLFERAPSTFAPADQIPAGSDYVIGPGDQLLVRLWGPETFNSQLTVDTAGAIYIPKVGSVHVAGLRYDELQKQISAEVSRVYRNFNLSVNLGHLRSIQVYVVGEARRPGAYTISSLSTVLNALFASGGPNVQGSLRRIQVRHEGAPPSEFDLYDLVLRGDKSKDLRLQSGDTIFIPPAGPQVALAGSVRHPAIYELRGATSLPDLLQYAGGYGPTAASDRLSVERIDLDHRRRTFSIATATEGATLALADGDVLYVNHISPGYEQSVTIRGNLANPGRFAWHAGMRLSEIIPDRKSLLTNDYWRERNRLGVPTPLFEPTEQNDRTLNRNQLGLPLAGSAMLNQNVLARDPYAGYSTDPQDLQNQALRANAAALALQSTQLPASSNSAQTTLFGQGAPGTTPSGISDGTANAQLSTVAPGPGNPDLRNLRPTRRVEIPAPEIDWSYAVIERLDPETLKSTLLPFNLGRLVQDHDATQDLELQPGDIVTILSQADIPVPLDEQTKFVRLEGEFVSAGTYSVRPGETLEDVVRRAGGLSSRAYLYGSSFLRESARAFQQQRLDEYISTLAVDMERATAVRAASSASGVLDPNALNEQRTLVAQLRQMRATGRVVLEFQPESKAVESIPQITLENGDIFRVPSRPNTVSVIGAVYGQNVFLYNPARHVGDYILLAGKPNRIADKQHAFIIRADGSIYSRGRAQGVLSNHFDEARINPGDSIVVPEKLIKPTALRQLIDYSQILSSFGLAAAAINVVR